MQKGSKLLKEETLDLVAERFRLLGDPMRLRLLQTLGDGERTVADLVETSSTTQANVSKHLQQLLRAGMVRRRKDGLYSYYSIADPSVFQLCDLVCGSIGARLNDQLAALPPEAVLEPVRRPATPGAARRKPSR